MTPGMVSPNSLAVIPLLTPKTTIVLVMVVPMFAPKTIGTPNLMAESRGSPLSTIPDMDTIVAATTALLLWTRAVPSTPRARPVTGAVLDSIMPRMFLCHSAKISLNPLFTPSSEQTNENIPRTRIRINCIFLSENTLNAPFEASGRVLDIKHSSSTVKL